VQHTNWNKIDADLGKNDFDRSGEPTGGGDEDWIGEDAGWHMTPITISIPFHHKAKASGQKNYLVGDLYHHSIVAVIHEKLANMLDKRHFYFEPFKLFWKPTPTSSDICMHRELYTSPVILGAHHMLQDSPREPGCNLQCCMVAIMFFSDGTHLMSFGTAKLWPGYFGNESKYKQCKPSCHLANHIVYFQEVSYPVHSAIFFSYGWLLPDAIKDFIEAYEHGIVVQCCNMIARRFYPKFITYSANYKKYIQMFHLLEFLH
jgi:hypothetical protein